MWQWAMKAAAIRSQVSYAMDQVVSAIVMNSALLIMTVALMLLPLGVWVS